jgi:hypothetical protein
MSLVSTSSNPPLKSHLVDGSASSDEHRTLWIYVGIGMTRARDVPTWYPWLLQSSHVLTPGICILPNPQGSSTCILRL